MKTYTATALLYLAAILPNTLSSVSIHDPASFFEDGPIDTNSLLSGLDGFDASLFVDNEDAKLTVVKIKFT